MKTSLPTQQMVICEGTDRRLCVKHKSPIPSIRPNEVLVQNKAVAVIPCNYKIYERFPCEGAVNGCDFAGIVVAVGTEVYQTGTFRIGDKVVGAVNGSNPARPESGSFAEYVASEAEFTLKMPPGMSYTEAVALGGTTLATLGMALFHHSLGLALPFPDAVELTAKPHTVFVHGGSSAVGTMALQLLRLAGHIPITTCSPKNFDMALQFGAERVFDYADPKCAKDIKAHTRNGLSHILDPFTDTESISLCTRAIGRAGGRYCCLEMYPSYLLEDKTLKVDFIMGPAILGHRLDLDYGYERGPDPAMRKFGIRWYQKVQEFLDQGRLRPHPVRILEGDWTDAVLQGIDLLKGKTVSGQKLVVVIDHT